MTAAEGGDEKAREKFEREGVVIGNSFYNSGKCMSVRRIDSKMHIMLTNDNEGNSPGLLDPKTFTETLRSTRRRPLTNRATEILIHATISMAYTAANPVTERRTSSLNRS